MTTRRSTIVAWLAEQPSRALHGIAFRLNHDRQRADLSERQEWFYGLVVSELELRRGQARWPEKRCSCELCLSPFEP